jgi:hypothetical protein
MRIDSFLLFLSHRITHSASNSNPDSDSDSDGSLILSGPPQLTDRLGLRLLMRRRCVEPLLRPPLQWCFLSLNNNLQGNEGRMRTNAGSNERRKENAMGISYQDR